MRSTRRGFLQTTLAVSLGFRGLRASVLRASSVPQDARATSLGPLVDDPKKLVDLPAAFSYRIVSTVGERMDDGFLVPGQPDGMGCFPSPDGRVILIRNHELRAENKTKGPFGADNERWRRLPAGLAYDPGRGQSPCLGGTTTLVYNCKDRRLDRQYLSLACTEYNCAGGPTPWGTWISCEETVQRADEHYERDHGYAFEVPAKADGRLAEPVPLKAMGRFRREAVAVEPKTSIVYQTEDRPDGLIYRFIPKRWGRLREGGRLQALSVRGRSSLDMRNWVNVITGRPISEKISVGTRFQVKWIDVDDIQAPHDDLRLRGFQSGAARFARAEGMWYGRSSIFFACTDGGRLRKGQIWRYMPSPNEGTSEEDAKPGELELFIEPNNPSLVENADNLTVAPWGDVIACEDGPGTQYLVGVTPTGRIYKLARNAANHSEFAGATFSPDGSTLFVNMQSAGLTFAITGPWPALRGNGGQRKIR
ncbi:MAG: PhoX family protein [Phycisphaerales bacterium]|nr:PhoX family protein [Phycisphaerales bacterium]